MGATPKGPSKPLTSALSSLPKGRVFGFDLASSDLRDASKAIVQAALDGERGYVCVTNVDQLTRARADQEFGNVERTARLVVPDGRPLVWLLQLMGFSAAQRLYGPDLTVAVCAEAAARGVPIYLYGGTERELQGLQRNLLKNFPTLRIAGAVSPPMLPARPPLDIEQCERINQSGAKIVFVGLGCPKQEYWMWAQREHLNALSIGVGLAFAQVAGLVPRAPDWMQRYGLEWVFRLTLEPRRLWKRVAVGNARYFYYVFIDLCTGRLRSVKPRTKS